MAIKNRKQIATIMSIILVIGFVMSALIYGYTFFKENIKGGGIAAGSAARNVVATVNGEKISELEYEKELYNLVNNSKTVLEQQKQQLAQVGMDTSKLEVIPEDILKEYTIQNLIDRKLYLTAAKDLKIKVSNKELNDEIKNLLTQHGGKEQFLSFIQQQGYRTIESYKKDYSKEILRKKVIETLQTKNKITDEEIKKMYERYKYTAFLDRDFEETKEEIKKSLEYENAELISSYIENLREKAKIEIKNPEVKKAYDGANSIIAQKDNYKVRKSIINEEIVMSYFTGQGIYNAESVNKAKSEMQKRLDGLVEIAKKAKEAGIKPKEGLSGLFELSSYSKEYYKNLIDTYKPTDEQIQAKFNLNKANYNIKDTISGNVVGNDFVASEKDFEVIKKQADELIKTVTKDNFAQKAKENSKDPGSAANGGSLGQDSDISGYVPEFANAVKSAKEGEIIQQPVKTQFGYHIIYVQSKNKSDENKATISHILLTPTVSDETKQNAVNELKKLKDELVSKKVTWDKVENQDKYKFDIKEQFKKLPKDAPIPGVGGNDTELSNKLFAANVGDIIEHQTEFGVFLLGKTGETKAKEVTLADVKDRIIKELAFEYANEQYKKFDTENEKSDNKS